MQFVVTFSLDNAEARDAGNAEAAAAYLREVAERVSSESGWFPGKTGCVRDGNGNTIGKWTFSGDDELVTDVRKRGEVFLSRQLTPVEMGAAVADSEVLAGFWI